MPGRFSHRRPVGDFRAREAAKKEKQKASWEALQSAVANKYIKET